MKWPEVSTRRTGSLPGLLFNGQVGVGLAVMPSQIEISLACLFWKISIYWQFRDFRPSGGRVGATFINGVEIETMSREDLISTVKSLASRVGRVAP